MYITYETALVTRIKKLKDQCVRGKNSYSNIPTVTQIED